MAFAKVGANNRILDYSFTQKPGFDVEFSNPDYVNRAFVGGVDDFIIVNGEAVFSPPAEVQLENTMGVFAHSDYVTSKFIDLLIQCDTVEDILSCIKNYREKYSETFANRESWRNKVNELTQEI